MINDVVPAVFTIPLVELTVVLGRGYGTDEIEDITDDRVLLLLPVPRIELPDVVEFGNGYRLDEDPEGTGTVGGAVPLLTVPKEVVIGIVPFTLTEILKDCVTPEELELVVGYCDAEEMPEPAEFGRLTLELKAGKGGKLDTDGTKESELDVDITPLVVFTNVDERIDDVLEEIDKPPASEAVVVVPGLEVGFIGPADVVTFDKGKGVKTEDDTGIYAVLDLPVELNAPIVEDSVGPDVVELMGLLSKVLERLPIRADELVGGNDVPKGLSGAVVVLLP